MYGADPRLADLGSKTGCRRMFEEMRGAVSGRARRTSTPSTTSWRPCRACGRGGRRSRQAIVKLNDGVSGSGNASLDLARAAATRARRKRPAAIAERIDGMQPEAEGLPLETFLAAFEKDGGIVEERITGVSLESPSVQMRALPDGTVELLSTHDQLLGGASGQKYLGCVFPADPRLRRAASPSPRWWSGGHLAQRGVLGRFAVDFVIVEGRGGAWTPYAIELNLRKGGTTHPFLTLQFLTGGSYDGERGVFMTPNGSHQVPGRDRPLRGRPAEGADRRRTCSTSWCNTACTSTSRAERAWCST